jgi:hypothetical protein
MITVVCLAIGFVYSDQLLFPLAMINDGNGWSFDWPLLHTFSAPTLQGSQIEYVIHALPRVRHVTIFAATNAPRFSGEIMNILGDRAFIIAKQHKQAAQQSSAISGVDTLATNSSSSATTIGGTRYRPAPEAFTMPSLNGITLTQCQGCNQYRALTFPCDWRGIFQSPLACFALTCVYIYIYRERERQIYTDIYI